jgi:pyruvate-formate lyase
VVNSDVLRDHVANPENYKNLLVRISGYNTYFVTLNKEMQIELIERAEFGMYVVESAAGERVSCCLTSN